MVGSGVFGPLVVAVGPVVEGSSEGLAVEAAAVELAAVDCAFDLDGLQPVGADGGSALTGQTVSVYKYARNGKAALSGTVAVAAGATSATVTGLRTGAAYSFTVAATNAVGTSPAAAMSNQVTVA